MRHGIKAGVWQPQLYKNPSGRREPQPVTARLYRSDKAIKRALPLPMIKKINVFDYARDIFLMSFSLDKYLENASNYLMLIIRSPGTNERYTYRNTDYNINHNLKKIAKNVGISIHLTLYVARYSGRPQRKAKGILICVISEGMRHESETTAQIYLASLDTSVANRVNSLILKAL